jgi:hypothetical protein
LRRWGALFAATLVVAVTAAWAPAEAAAQRQEVLVFAPGGFSWRQPVGWLRRGLDDAGFKPIMAEYPLRDLLGADRYARQLAKEHPRSYAVGLSAGGTLAANLAARDLVTRTVTVSAPSNLRRVPWEDDYWDKINATPWERWRISPTRTFRIQGPHRRMLILHSPDDWLVPWDQAEEMAGVSGGRLRAGLPGGHGDWASELPRIVRYLAP